MEEDFFSHYITYTSDTEPPVCFHRWCAIVGIGALLGRQYFFEHGHFRINPNIYSMLIGSPGTRKSFSIKLIRKLLVEAGYNTIAADKTTKEKFILDLSGAEDEEKNGNDILEQNLFGDSDTREDSEIFIMADEFNDFFGNGNIEFISLLGTLWDYSGVYRNRIKNGKSVSIPNPTISILGGNTPTGFSLAFPTEILGQGFFSRLLLIYGESSGRRITFPKPPSAESTQFVVNYLREIKSRVFGPAKLTPEAERLLDRIYQRNLTVDDVRFESYSNRRFNHLIKLCLVVSANRLSTTITESDVIYANTILTHTEHFMPKALGEFGKAKNSDVVHKVMQKILSSDGIVRFKDLWKHVASDLEKQQDLATILQNLEAADKIQKVTLQGQAAGFLPKRKVIGEGTEGMIDFSKLTAEERNMRL